MFQEGPPGCDSNNSSEWENPMTLEVDNRWDLGTEYPERCLVGWCTVDRDSLGGPFQLTVGREEGTLMFHIQRTRDYLNLKRDDRMTHVGSTSTENKGEKRTGNNKTISKEIRYQNRRGD